MPKSDCWLNGFSGVSDHGTVQQDATLSATNNRHCASVTITDDTLPEKNEVFQITLSNIRRIESNFFSYQVHTPVATVTILDNDGK